jgi:hypothetical protein
VRRAAETPPAPLAPAPGEESAGAALAPLPAPDGAEDDRLSRVLPVLLAHEGALRVFGSTRAVEHPVFERLPPGLSAALRSVARANDTTRGAARLATLCRTARATARAGSSAAAATNALCVQREHVLRAILALLVGSDAQDALAAARGSDETQRHDPDAYISSDDEEGDALARVLMLCGDNVPRVLEELARWTAVPELPRLPPLQNTGRMLLRREFEATAMLVQSSAELRRARSEANREWHAEWLETQGRGGGAQMANARAAPQPAPPAPPSEAERLESEGHLMAMTCMMLTCAETLHETMRGLSLGGAGALPQL